MFNSVIQILFSILTVYQFHIKNTVKEINITLKIAKSRTKYWVLKIAYKNSLYSEMSRPSPLQDMRNTVNLIPGSVNTLQFSKPKPNKSSKHTKRSGDQKHV